MPEQPEPVAPEAPEQNQPAEPARAEPDWKAEARKWESRAKENKDAARRLTELEESQKTEQQKLTERLAEAERAAATREAELLRWRTAAKHGISDEDAATFLTGGDEETLTRQAQRLVALRGQASASARTPVEALQPGAAPAGGAAKPLDMNEWMRQRTTR